MYKQPQPASFRVEDAGQVDIPLGSRKLIYRFKYSIGEGEIIEQFPFVTIIKPVIINFISGIYNRLCRKITKIPADEHNIALIEDTGIIYKLEPNSILFRIEAKDDIELGFVIDVFQQIGNRVVRAENIAVACKLLIIHGDHHIEQGICFRSD